MPLSISTTTPKILFKSKLRRGTYYKSVLLPKQNIQEFGANAYTKQESTLLVLDIIPNTASSIFNIFENTVKDTIVPVKIKMKNKGYRKNKYYLSYLTYVK